MAVMLLSESTLAAGQSMQSTCVYWLSAYTRVRFRSQALQPSRWATATLMASSDSLSPTAVIGGAWSQSPEWREDAAISLAVSTSLTALARRGVRWFAATSPSQAFCMCWTSAGGLPELDWLAHKASMHSRDPSSIVTRCCQEGWTAGVGM